MTISCYGTMAHLLSTISLFLQWWVFKLLKFFNWAFVLQKLLHPYRCKWSWVRIRLRSCSKSHTLVPSTTRWALSNGAIRFFISQTMVPKIPKYWYFPIELWIRIRVIPCRICSGTCSNCSSYVPSTTRRALSNGVLRFLIAQRKSFGPIDGARENLKIIFWLILNLSIPLDRAHRVLLGTRTWVLEQFPKRISPENTRIQIQLHWRQFFYWIDI